MIPEIENTTREERRAYIENRFRCISDCDNCGICAMYRNQDPLLVYRDYIEGTRTFMEITAEYR